MQMQGRGLFFGSDLEWSVLLEVFQESGREQQPRDGVACAVLLRAP